ncbi:MAG: DUF1800 domain-containing protein, partial [Caulobacteraceae bacterium]
MNAQEDFGFPRRAPPLAIDRKLRAAIAVTRFGLGAKPGEIDQATGDPETFLIDQIRREGADQPSDPPPSSAERFGELRQFQMLRRQAKDAGDPQADPVKLARKLIRQDAGADFLARLRLAATTDAAFRERWALFFANHFTVSATKFTDVTLVGPFEAEAIRPNCFGRFHDLLVASSRNPAMLIYLDQAQSIGPDSPAARFRDFQGKKAAGLNENLGREMMELHTIGVEAGYSQADVTEFSKALTGWSIGGLNEPATAGRFVFRPRAHEPGARTIMGKRYAEGGEDQALAVMADLAASPHTAHHLGLELARHFVADDQPPSLVEKLKRSYLTSGGDLSEVARTLIRSPESWGAAQNKFKRPYEFMVSSWRAAGWTKGDLLASPRM